MFSFLPFLTQPHQVASRPYAQQISHDFQPLKGTFEEPFIPPVTHPTDFKLMVTCFIDSRGSRGDRASWKKTLHCRWAFLWAPSSQKSDMKTYY